MKISNIALSVPGTIINRIYSEDENNNYMIISFCEDGFIDEDGIPYVMEGMVDVRRFPQNRIMVSYDDEGYRLIEPINGDNWTQIGVEAPENVKNLNYNKAKKIYHRNALKLCPGAVLTPKSEVEEIARRSSYKKGRFIVAGICFAVLWFIFIGLILVFGGIALMDINFNLWFAFMLAGIIGWIVLSVLSIKFSLRIPIRRLLRMNNREEILFMGNYYSTDLSGFKTQYVNGVIRDGNTFLSVNHSVAIGCDKFLSDIKRGTIMYRYFEKDDTALNFGCMFVKKDEATQSHTSSSDNS